MNFMKQFLMGAIGGFVVVSIFVWIPFDKMVFPTEIVAIALYIIVLFSWIFILTIANQIKKLVDKDLEGDEEDEAEEIINKKFYDFSFSNNIGAILAILGLALSMFELNLPLIIIGIIATIVSYAMMSYMIKLMQVAYPTRNLPEVGDKKYSKKLLEISDEGERHVMLYGLYKTYIFANAAFVFAIIGITLYSVIAEDSQLFSVLIITAILIVMNGMYFTSIRNR